MSEEYRQYLNNLHGCEFTITMDPKDVNVIHYINEAKHIVVTALANEIAPGITAPNPVPDNKDKLKKLLRHIEINQRRNYRKLMATGFGFGFAVGMFVATASIYCVQVVFR